MLNEGQKHKKLQADCIFDRRIKKKKTTYGPGQLQFAYSIPNTNTVSLHMDEKYCIS